jgi:hypothetical protein
MASRKLIQNSEVQRLVSVEEQLLPSDEKDEKEIIQTDADSFWSTVNALMEIFLAELPRSTTIGDDGEVMDPTQDELAVAEEKLQQLAERCAQYVENYNPEQIKSIMTVLATLSAIVVLFTMYVVEFPISHPEKTGTTEGAIIAFLLLMATMLFILLCSRFRARHPSRSPEFKKELVDDLTYLQVAPEQIEDTITDLAQYAAYLRSEPERERRRVLAQTRLGLIAEPSPDKHR